MSQDSQLRDYHILKASVNTLKNQLKNRGPLVGIEKLKDFVSSEKATVWDKYCKWEFGQHLLLCFPPLSLNPGLCFAHGSNSII